MLFQALACGVGAQSEVPSMLESVQCRLETGSSISVQYSTFLESYVQINPSTIAYLQDDDYTKENPILQVRVCWCSQYFHRRYEYCPEQFDSCRVEGIDGPITCFQDQEGGAFVRGFWFICVFWFISLSYAFSCTEQGSSARDFVKRKICIRLRGHSSEETFLRDEIEIMIEQDPDRATWLLRSAFLRERTRQRTQEAISARRGRSSREEEPTGEHNTEGATLNTEGGTSGRNANNPLSPWQQKMELKVKKYEGPIRAGGAVATTENQEVNLASSSFSLASASQMLSNALNLNGMDASEMEEANCAICLSTVEVGDRIGDIPCGHIYCIECLKVWLQRKNHCPLCMRGGIATPARASMPATVTPASVEASVTSAASGEEIDPEQGVEVSPRRSTGSGSGALMVSMPDIVATRLRRES